MWDQLIKDIYSPMVEKQLRSAALLGVLAGGTPEEIAKRKAESTERARLAKQAREDRWGAVYGRTVGTLFAKKVVELHKPSTGGVCQACTDEVSTGYDAEPLDWPCATFILAEENL